MRSSAARVQELCALSKLSSSVHCWRLIVASLAVRSKSTIVQRSLLAADKGAELGTTLEAETYFPYSTRSSARVFAGKSGVVDA